MADVVVVTNLGLSKTTGRLKGSDSDEPKYIGWGDDDDPAPAATQTDLEGAANENRVAGTSSLVTTTTTDDTYQLVGTITSLSAQTIVEVAQFDAAGTGTPPSGGNMFLRGTFTGIGLGIGDSIQFTIKTVYDQA